jgi:hypothetical protein
MVCQPREEIFASLSMDCEQTTDTAFDIMVAGEGFGTYLQRSHAGFDHGRPANSRRLDFALANLCYM